MLVYLYLSFTVAIIVSVNIVRLRISQINRDDYATLVDRYIDVVTTILLSESHDEVVMRSSQHKDAAIEAMYVVVSHTYGVNKSLLRDMVKVNRLDEYVVRMVCHSRGATRAKWLIWATALPMDQRCAVQLRRYVYSGDKIVRSSAILTQLSQCSSRAIPIIASLHYRLTPFDVSRIVILLRRGLLPIAYEPLLSSKNTNMQMLGLAIVRNFGIDIAEHYLQGIIASSNDQTLTREALYTLSCLGRPLGRQKVRSRLEAMGLRERGELCRFLSVEGYSLPALRTLFSEREIQQAEILVKSYKRDLVCTPRSS